MFSHLIPHLIEKWDISISLGVFLIATATFYQKFFQSHSCLKRFNDIPGPKQMFLYMESLRYLTMSISDLLQLILIKNVKDFGSIYRLRFGYHKTVILSSPELIERVLRSPALNKRSELYYLLAPWMEKDSFFLTDGHDWKIRRRSILSEQKNVIIFTEIFNKQSVRCVQAFMDQQKGDVGTIKIDPLVTAWAVNIAFDTTIGIDKTTDDDRISYTQNMERMFESCVTRLKKPWLINDWIYGISKLGRENSDQKKKQQKLMQKFVTLLNVDSPEDKERPKNPNKVLDIEQDLDHNHNLSDNADPHHNGIGYFVNHCFPLGADPEDRERLRCSNMDNALLSVYDSTSSTMKWFLYCIAKHPDQQKRIVEELESVFADDWYRPCTMDDSNQLKYLDCCIKESLRLYPSIPIVGRSSTTPVDIGGYEIPAGTSIMINIYGLHHSPVTFPDPAVFNPQRFLPENNAGRHRYAFIPFSAGPRNCIGQSFAWLALKIFISTLLRRFEFATSTASEQIIKPSYLGMLVPEKEVELVVSKRTRLN